MRWTSLTIRALGYGPPTSAPEVPVWIPRWQRRLEFAGGIVARTVPVLVCYRGQERTAERMRQRLHRYGYTRVTLEKRPRKRNGE